MTTFHLRRFEGGRDLRQGIFAGKEKNRFSQLTNYYTGKDKFLHRRPPVKAVTGTLSANAQGLVILNGALYQIAKKGDVVTNTIVSPAINTLRFDNPDHCTTWQLIQAKVYNGNVVALIRHVYPGGTVTSRIFLHVFDGSTTKPTYVEDPFCPTSWAPTLPLHVYRKGDIGAFLDYNPRMCVAVQKLHISGPDGNLYFSKTKNARSWNTRTQAEFQSYGEWYYYVTNSTVGLQNFIVSEDYTRLFTDGGFSSFVLEYLDATGTWIQVDEDTAAPVADKHYQPQSVAGRLSGVANEIRLQVYWTGGAGTILRFRLIVGAPPISASGVTLTRGTTSESFNGNGATVAFQTVSLTQLDSSIHVVVGGVVKTVGVDYTLSLVGGFTKVTFGVAPPAGTGNVDIIETFSYHVAKGATLTYEESILVIDEFSHDIGYSGNIFGTNRNVKRIFYNPASPNIISGSFSLSSATPALTITGQNRYRYLYLIDTQWGPATPDMVYSRPFVTGAQAGMESSFFKDQSALYLKYAGFGDAGFLATQAKNNTGGLIIDLSAVNSTVIVYYAEQSQLWTIFSDQTLNKFEDDSDVGSGNHAGGTAVKFYNESLVLTALGLRAFSAGNFNNDNLEDNNIGDPIEEFTGYEFLAGCFWSRTGQLVCALDDGEATELHVFSYSKESKVSSWSKYESSALGRINRDGLLPLNGKLYYVTVDRTMFYFDQEETNKEFDLTATPYDSTARWPLMMMDQPGLSKVYQMFQIAASGTWEIAFTLLTGDTEIEVPGPVDEGSTYGKGHVDLGMEGQALGLIVRNSGAPTDSGVTDSVIQAIQIDFDLVGI